MISYDERWRASERFQRGVGHLNLPQYFSVASIQADQLSVRRSEIESIFIHCKSAVAGPCQAALRGPVKMPDLPASTGIDRPHVAGQSKVQNPVYLERRRVYRARHFRLEGPRERHRVHIDFIDRLLRPI